MLNGTNNKTEISQTHLKSKIYVSNRFCDHPQDKMMLHISLKVNIWRNIMILLDIYVPLEVLDLCVTSFQKGYKNLRVSLCYVNFEYYIITSRYPDDDRRGI